MHHDPGNFAEMKGDIDVRRKPIKQQGEEHHADPGRNIIRGHEKPYAPPTWQTQKAGKEPTFGDSKDRVAEQEVEGARPDKRGACVGQRGRRRHYDRNRSEPFGASRIHDFRSIP